MPKISIRSNAGVQAWRVNIPEDHSLSGWLLHIITCRRKSHYSRPWSLCEGQNSNYSSSWIKTLTRALIKRIWAGVNGAVDPTGTSWKGLTNPKPEPEPDKGLRPYHMLQVKKLINRLHCRPCQNTPARSMHWFMSMHLCQQVTLVVEFHLTNQKWCAPSHRGQSLSKILIMPLNWNAELQFELNKSLKVLEVWNI